MTKKEMIKVIQQKEAEAWLQVKVDEKMFGQENIITSRSRSEWARLHDLMKELEIKPAILKKAIKIAQKSKLTETNADHETLTDILETVGRTV